jgi:hypothetical protein
VVDAKIEVYGTAQTDYLVGGEGLIVRKSEVEIVKTICVSGETEESDEFETDGITEALLHFERANVAQSYLAGGKVSVTGEVLLSVCSLKDETVLSHERQIPFGVELPVDENVEKLPVYEKTTVKSAQITVTADEEKNKSKTSVALVLYTECIFYVKEKVSVCDDLFSTDCNLLVKEGKVGGRYLTNVQRFTERISGNASISAGFDGDFTLQAVVKSKAELYSRKTPNGYEAEGVIEAEALFDCADGIKCATLTLPFVFPLQADDGEVELDGAAYGLNVRKVGDKVEADCVLKVTARSYLTTESKFVAEAEEGEKLEKPTSAISIYIPTEGDGLWEISKKLNRDPVEVQKSNPNLEFPIKKGERLFIYRQWQE